MTLAKNTDTAKAKRAPRTAKPDTTAKSNAPTAPPAAAVTPDNVAAYIVAATAGKSARAAKARVIGHPVAASGSTLPAVVAVLNAGIAAHNLTLSPTVAPVAPVTASGDTRHYCDAYGYAFQAGMAHDDDAIIAAHRISTGVVKKKDASAAVAAYVAALAGDTVTGTGERLAAFIRTCELARKTAEDAKKNAPKSPVIGSQGADNNDDNDDRSTVAAAAVAALNFPQILALADAAILAAGPADARKMIAALAGLAARHSTPVAPVVTERLAKVTPEMIATSAARAAARAEESAALAAINESAHRESESARRAALALAGK